MTPAVVTRTQWLARPPKSTPQSLRGFQEGWFVHHGGTSLDARAAEVVRSYQRYHMDVQHWDDIGYNFLVDPFTGDLYEGRGWGIIGAATKGHNSRSMSVCIIGNAHTAVSEPTKASILWLIEEGKQKGWTADVGSRAHRDVSPTSCPGDAAARWVHAGMPYDPPVPSPPTNEAALSVRYDYQSAVYVSYRTIANREPDPAGWAHWTKAYDDAVTAGERIHTAKVRLLGLLGEQLHNE